MPESDRIPILNQPPNEAADDWRSDWLSITGEEYSIQSFLIRCHPNDLRKVVRRWITAMRDGIQFRAVYRVCNKNAEWVRVAANGSAGTDYYGRLRICNPCDEERDVALMPEPVITFSSEKR
jgi:hypothetical protein